MGRSRSEESGVQLVFQAAEEEEEPSYDDVDFGSELLEVKSYSDFHVDYWRDVEVRSRTFKDCCKPDVVPCQALNELAVVRLEEVLPHEVLIQVARK